MTYLVLPTSPGYADVVHGAVTGSVAARVERPGRDVEVDGGVSIVVNDKYQAIEEEQEGRGGEAGLAN